MKLGIYYHAALDPEIGGGTIFQETIIEEIRRNNSHHQIYIFSPTIPDCLPEDTDSVRFVKLDNGRANKLAKTTKALSRVASYGIEELFDKEFIGPSPLERALQGHKIDLLWFISTRVERITVPYIATVWDLAHRTHPYFPEVSVTGWKWSARERHYQELLPRASMIITGTAVGKTEITQYYRIPEHLVQVVPFPPSGFALAPDAPLSKQAHDAGAQLPDRYLFYPAQFWPHKNHVGLLLSLKILREQYGLDFKLVLCGSDKGNLSYVQEKVKELGLGDAVIFFGFVKTEFMKKLYRRAFALAYPTFFGPDNLPPLEAFALGCPVIASRVEGAEEQLGNAAVLFDPNNPEEMASRIRDLYENPALRDELIRRGRERAFSWTPSDYVQHVFDLVDKFETIRRCWSSQQPYIQT